MTDALVDDPLVEEIADHLKRLADSKASYYEMAHDAISLVLELVYQMDASEIEDFCEEFIGELECDEEE